MIKKSTYIRSFTAVQHKQLEKVAKEQNIKTVPEILFFSLDAYLEQKQEIERLKRIIQLKKDKIDELNLKIDFFKSASKKIHELSNYLKNQK
ncbi:hypothetical protein [Flavobacterium hydatis]|uniref:Uncharacterized protein n=1 Tax=Flavobacterium hydatis TaxID=991 RepID=A0A086AKZ0_FLAHY|nr:hypothetical protein [Flavobacterium hydatis]KFF17354.1 hypothetical protein IW20_08420 [Flavobacterium hydatis]OXA85041.1 hypothetical protein B0A62_24740 [Flavobacterium hydatis]